MNRRKLWLIVIVLAVLAVGFMLLRVIFSGDEIQPQLQSIMNNQQTISELSDAAAQNASVYELKTKAATVAVTTASDNQQLQTFYKQRYRKDFKPAKSQEAQQLIDTQPGSGYDSKYKELVRKQLETNQASLRTVYNQSQNQQLKDLIKTAFNNQNAALEQIK